MASVYYLYDDGSCIEEDIVSQYLQHIELHQLQYFAALKIQRLWRGYAVRKMIKNWNRAATIIQKYVRGWLVRYFLPDILHEYFDRMCVNYYNKCAAKIQALWKGYQLRKIICIKDNVEKRRLVKKANEDIARLIREKYESRTSPDSIERQQQYLESILRVMFERHHLLRTRQREGVLSTHGSQEYSELEKLISILPWTDYMKKLKKIYNKYSQIPPETKHKYDDKNLIAQEDLYRLRNTDNDLKPLIIKDNVIDFHDKPFQLIAKNTSKSLPYERSLGGYEKYVSPIKNITRKDDKSLNIVSDADFNINTFKKIAAKSNTPAYYIDFWMQKCPDD